MGQWTDKQPCCIRCTTTRYERRGRGLCTRCYPLERRLEEVLNWDLTSPQTLKRFPFPLPLSAGLDFPTFKRKYAEQIERRLGLLRQWEEDRNGDVSGLTIEYQLCNLAELAGSSKGWYLHHGLATAIDHSFDREQKQFLFRLLNDIEETIRWPGVNLYEALRTDR